MRDPALAVLRPDTVFQRRYRVVRCLDAGGMGAVYEVLDERTDARRALKVMLPGIVEDPVMRARFAREARITGSIESEHIVRTMDAGVDEETGTPFLVMELLRGEDLGALLARRGGIPAREVVIHLFQAALALDKTHAAAIVHRDLKPENLFLTKRDDGSPCLKILDFGIAKLMSQSTSSRTTKSMGTPLYMAPEQASGKGTAGPRADIYALGHIAYSLLAGAPYWEQEWRESEAPLAFLSEVVKGVPEAASARASRRGVTLTTAFDGWFLKATAVGPADRFESAGEAVEALAEALQVPLPRPSHVDIEIDGGGRFGVSSGDPTPADRSPTLGSETVPVAAPQARGSGTTSAPLSGVPAPSRTRRRLPVVLAGVAACAVVALVLAVRSWVGAGLANGPAGAGSSAQPAPSEHPSAPPLATSAPEPPARAPASVAPPLVSASAPAPDRARPPKARRPAAPSAQVATPSPPPRESFF